jgi:prepilin-type N-terminal cleavage/methylation domain-containing protein
MMRCSRISSGFSLLEVAVVIAVVGLLVAGLAGPLSSQIDQRRLVETRALLKASETAILAFAATNGRLPCPASATSNGIEVSRDAAGRCQIVGGNGAIVGYVPARTLGLSPLDSAGYLTDAWGTTPDFRIGYAIIDTVPPGTGAAGDFSAARVAGFNSVFTRDNALNGTYTLASGTNLRNWQALSQYVNTNYSSAFPAKGLLHVCRSATGISGLPGLPKCGNPTNGTNTPSANTLSDQAPVVLFSLGLGNNTAPYAPARLDEAPNLPTNADRLFVSHERAEAAAVGGAFDDVVSWVSLNTLFSKMLEGGRLSP